MRLAKIEVYGTNCASCKTLAKNVDKALAELEISATVVKIDSMQEIMNRGIMMVPALYIDGEARAFGRAPSVEEIKKMIKDGDG
jgi:small redox-active disulfide protein 2